MTKSKKFIGYHCVLVLSGVLALSGAAVAGPDPRPVTLEQLPQRWRDDADHELTLTALRGHRVVLTMAYASCHRICPMTIDALKQLQQIVDDRGESVDFVVIGYDPGNDTPAVWHQYRTRRQLRRDNWHFLSGSRPATLRLAQQLGFPFWTYDEHVMHESRVVVFDTEGVQRAALGAPTSHWADAL